MGALQSKRNRSLDSVWTSNKDIIAVLEAMMGVSIGTDNGPLFIQDEGQKLKDRVYVDRNTGKMYSCVTDNTSIVNDINFLELNVSNSNNKIQNSYKVIHDDYNVPNDTAKNIPYPDGGRGAWRLVSWYPDGVTWSDGSLITTLKVDTASGRYIARRVDSSATTLNCGIKFVFMHIV